MVDSISAKDALGRLNDGKAVFIDVREPDEWAATGIVPGALTVPMSALNNDGDAGGKPLKDALSGGNTLIVYCATGRRSATVGEHWRRQGVPHIFNLVGGIVAWRGAGGKVVRAN